MLSTDDDRLEELLGLAHEVRVKWCGPEVEGIVSLKIGGCPEDGHFCSQSDQFTSPVRSVWLNIGWSRQTGRRAPPARRISASRLRSAGPTSG